MTEVTKMETIGPRTIWQVKVPDTSDEAAHRLGKAAARYDANHICQAIDRSVSSAGERPAWLNQLFIPRGIPSPMRPRMRRFNGRRVEPMYVFGNDDRKIYEDSSYPWGCVGKLFNSDGFHGSGALVGKNLVITAAHMVPWTSIGAGSWWMRFVPAYFNGTSLFGSGVESYISDVSAFNNGNNVSGYDWALLKLYNPLGAIAGWFGYNGWSSDWEKQNYWTVLGYPDAVGGGEVPSWQGGIDYHDEDSDSNGGEELESNTADITPGDSGGPVFGTWSGNHPRVIGVVSGQEHEYVPIASSDDNNIFASGSGFTNLIAWGLTNWPS
jgi:V8-like Glu-specific endopeptidase